MQTSPKKILAISGSTKQGASNGAVLRYLAQHFQDRLTVELYEAIDTLPHFNPDLDQAIPPPAVLALREKIAAADGVIFCTPEYVFSLPGSLKNAIEWMVSTTLFSNKAVAIIVAAASGEKAMEALTLIMTTIEARIAPEAKLLIKGIRGKMNPEGKLQDEKTEAQLRNLVDAFLKSILAENPQPDKYV